MYLVLYKTMRLSGHFAARATPTRACSSLMHFTLMYIVVAVDYAREKFNAAQENFKNISRAHCTPMMKR